MAMVQMSATNAISKRVTGSGHNDVDAMRDKRLRLGQNLVNGLVQEILAG